MNARHFIVMLALATGLGLSTADAQITQIIDASGDGVGASLSAPLGIAVAPNGNVYVAGANSDNVFEIVPDGTVSLFAQLSGAKPGRIGVDGAGNVFVQDYQGPRVYKISPSGTVKVVLTVLGDGEHLYDDGEGLAVGANGIAYASGSGCTDPAPGPCQAEEYANVFRISPSALPELVLDKTGGGLISLDGLSGRYEVLAVDSVGNLYAASNVGNVVLKVTPTNVVSIAISFALEPRFFSSTALAVDADDNLYVVTELDRIFRVTPGGSISEVSYTGLAAQEYVVGMAAAPNGALYLLSNTSDEVVQVLPNGTTTVVMNATGDGGHAFDAPDIGGIAVDASGNVYATGSESKNAFKIVTGLSVQTSAQQKCVNVLNKGLQQVARTQAKDVLGCVRDGAKGALGPMTIDACVTADRKGKVLKARTKVQLADDKSCGTTRAPYGDTSADIVSLAAINAATTLTSDLFGADLGAAVVASTHAAAACQAAAIKSLTACEDAYLKEFIKCKKAGLKSQSILDADGIAACIGNDPGGKIAKVCAPTSGKIRAELDKRCTALDLQATFPGQCAGGDTATVATCLNDATRCRVCRAAKNADALNVDCDTLDDGQANASCVPICGDGFVEGTEACDDGNVASEDGCSAACASESCGDGTVQAGLGEGCDDGNQESLDGCSATCIAEFCGDGITNDLPNELCDGADDDLCPGACQVDCSCVGPITVGDHQCRPAAGSLITYHDSNSGVIESPISEGALVVSCGQVDELTGRAPCTCSLTEPLLASNLLNICLIPTGESCAAGTIDCDGGDPLDVEVVSDHDIGSCAGNAACATQCDSYCAASGAEAFASSCEGYCAGGPNDGLACTAWSQCPLGICSGAFGNPIVHPNTCGCHCRTIGGSPAPGGGLACQVAVEAVVEMYQPCGDGDVMLRLGKQCLQLTSQVTNATLLDTNLGTLGPFSTVGGPKACTELGIRGAGGLTLTAAIDTFHGNGDRDSSLVYDLICE